MECLICLATLLILGTFDVSHGASSYLQPSHSSAFTKKPNHIRTSLTPVDRYEEINSGIVSLDSYVSTTSRYHGPNLEDVSAEGGRFRRDVSSPDGAVFDSFHQYVPFGKIQPIPIATFTDGDFDFDAGFFTAPYPGAYFFLYHGPFGNEPDSLTVGLVSEHFDGDDTIATSHAFVNATAGVSGVLPIVLSMEQEDTAFIELKDYPRQRAKFSSIFNVFDLYRKY